MKQAMEEARDKMNGPSLADEIVPISCVARTVECFLNNGFNNFRIVTLKIREGLVVAKELSDPYASWDAISRLEIKNHEAILRLNSGWADGKAWDS